MTSPGNLLRACFESLAYICVVAMHKNPPLEVALVSEQGPLQGGDWLLEYGSSLRGKSSPPGGHHCCHTFDKSHLALRGFCHQHQTELKHKTSE